MPKMRHPHVKLTWEFKCQYCSRSCSDIEACSSDTQHDFTQCSSVGTSKSLRLILTHNPSLTHTQACSHTPLRTCSHKRCTVRIASRHVEIGLKTYTRMR